MPTIPSTPLIEAGQVEVSAGMRSLNSFEAGAAWAPVPHLLLTAEAAVQPNAETRTVNNVSTTYHDSHRQVGFGVGAYRAASARLPLYLAAVGGVGFASMDLHSLDVGVLFILPVPVPVPGAYYQATYRRYYGQLYAAYPTESITTGLSVRGTFVDYTRLLADGQPFAPATRFFLEPTFFVRTRPWVLQWQFMVGISTPVGRRADDQRTQRTAPVSVLIGAGLVFRPDLLRHRPK
ncbi:hypothetical protein [Hymenobacter bucti]|uniref:Outer membrane protein beta-barrel domain-containing protein n=1 Tax=Hymenobacter bucti TaxID=1844114 RepID=A0ABW4QRH8_9BACT